MSTSIWSQIAAAARERGKPVIPHGYKTNVEIAAQLEMPLGVARVLVGDMLDAGLVSVHRPQRPTERPDRALMEKVLDGLQTL